MCHRARGVYDRGFFDHFFDSIITPITDDVKITDRARESGAIAAASRHLANERPNHKYHVTLGPRN